MWHVARNFRFFYSQEPSGDSVVFTTCPSVWALPSLLGGVLGDGRAGFRNLASGKFLGLIPASLRPANPSPFTVLCNIWGLIPRWPEAEAQIQTQHCPFLAG